MISKDRNAALRELAALLPGQVTVAGDPGWDEARLGWVRSVDQQPGAVVTVNDDEDVVAAVRWAALNGFSVSAQPVGHGATSAVDGTVLLRTRALSDITIDLDRGTARVGAGVKWGELLTALNGSGMTGLAGSSPDTSVVGYTLGGGLSWFGRAYGLAAHSVVAVEMVDADGQLRRVTGATDPDLFWAIRGGGGDFGIVTMMEFVLHPAAHVYGGRLLWPVTMARPVLEAFREITRTAPDELSLWGQLVRVPALPEIPEPLRGGSFVTVDLTFLGSADDAEHLLAPLRALPAPMVDTLGTVELADLGGICAEPVDPLPVSEQTTLLDGLDDAAITTLLGAVQHGPDLVLDVVQVRHLGGAFTRASAADGAAGPIHEPYLLAALAVPVNAEVGARIQKVFAAITQAMSGWLSERTPFNFLGADRDPSRALTTAALDRLGMVKSAVDPASVFRSNRPIRTPSRVIAVTGATGAQGGSLIRAILEHPESGLVPRAVTRNPASAAAQALAALGVEVVRADLDDRSSLEAAFAGVHGAFCMTNFWEHFDADREKIQAANLAAAAASAKVRHAVWSTLEDTRDWMPLSDERMPTMQGAYKVPHMDSKAESDHHFTDAGVPTTFLIASFYWENMINLGLGPQRGPDGLELILPLADAALPGIAVADIGASAYEIFRAGPPAAEERVGIAGDHLTGTQLAAALSEALGEEVRYRPLTADAFRALGFPGADDMGNMFQFIADFNADNLALRPLAATRLRHPGLQDFPTWLAKNAAALPIAAR
ncbi:NmrA family NAD(P)-binding protein [Actinoplanes sp. M2I2]|uniref:NmrA family NAD(P)-binding protein n=1 Tax=Actinoplanes sp. M2I2 TaxID=1734444 RepID=UPI0020220040|nr:NmrA family NAD(P)-binding protein [Actinoplanes sp. M2I2]